MAGIVDGISALINPTNVIQAGGNALMMGFMTGNIANALPSAAMNLGMRGLSAAITPRPNTGNGIANALNTYSPPQQPTPQISKAENIGQVVQNIGETLISRVETTNALLQKLIDVQTGRSDDMDYRKKATQYGRMAQALSRSAMGRIFLTVMGNTIGRQSADLQYVTKGALQSGVTNAKEILTTRLLSELPGLSKYFKSKFDDLAKNILRIQTPYTKETDMTINKIIPNSLKSIGELMNSHLSEQTTHLSVISSKSIEISAYIKNMDSQLTKLDDRINSIHTNLVTYSDMTVNGLETVNNSINDGFGGISSSITTLNSSVDSLNDILNNINNNLITGFNGISERMGAINFNMVDNLDSINRNIGKIMETNNTHYTQVENVLNLIYRFQHILTRNNRNNRNSQNNRNNQPIFMDDMEAFSQNIRGFLTASNNNQSGRNLPATQPPNGNAVATQSNRTPSTTQQTNNNNQQQNETTAIKSAVVAVTDKLSEVVVPTFQDVLKTLQEQQKTLEASTKDQTSLKDTVKQNDIRNQYLQNLSDTASSLLTNMIDLRSSFSMFSMNLPNLLTRSLSSIIKVGIGMFLGRQLIGLLYRVFTGSTNNIGKNGFIGTLWHEGIFSAIMYAKDKIAGYLGDALNWVFSAITGKESFKATINEYYNKGKEKVWNYFLDSLPTLIEHVVEGFLLYRFTIETLKPMGLTIINGITNFIPDVFKGLRKGFSWLWGTFESTKGYQLTLGKLSEIKKNILESLEAGLGEWNTSTSDIVESSFRGKIRGPIKVIMSPFGNKLNRIMAKSIANNNEELLDLIKNTKVLNNENMNEFLKNVKESQLNLVNHSVLKITENIRKIFRVTEIEKDDSFMLKGLRTAAAVPLWGAKQGLNLLSIAIKGIGSVFGSLFSSLLKNPALTLNGIRLVKSSNILIE